MNTRSTYPQVTTFIFHFVFVSLICGTVFSVRAGATGSIRGVVSYSGTLPKMKMNVTSDAACGKEHPLDRLVLGPANSVQYALVYLKNPPPGTTSTMTQASIAQTGCRFVPHMVIAARGSNVEIKNNDPVLHNCHGYSYIYTGNRIERSTVFNLAQPNQGQVSQQALRKQGMISIECDAGHTWMSGWIWVTANPYAAVTNAKGEFSFEGLPAGTYTVVMWHEGWQIKDSDPGGRPIFSDPVASEEVIVVGDGAATTCDFILH